MNNDINIVLYIEIQRIKQRALSKDSVIPSNDHNTQVITYFCADSLLYMIK